MTVIRSGRRAADTDEACVVRDVGTPIKHWWTTLRWLPGSLRGVWIVGRTPIARLASAAGRARVAVADEIAGQAEPSGGGRGRSVIGTAASNGS